jgi:hypothetical protein
MEEAAVRNLKARLTTEIYNNLALLPQESAIADDDLNRHLHEGAMPLLDEGTRDWTEFDLLAAFTGQI